MRSLLSIFPTTSTQWTNWGDTCCFSINDVGLQLVLTYWGPCLQKQGVAGQWMCLCFVLNLIRLEGDGLSTENAYSSKGILNHIKVSSYTPLIVLTRCRRKKSQPT